MELTVGSRVILKREMLGERVGSVGFVFTIYPDFDDASKDGVQVIFQGGGYDGFSQEEQELYLDDRGVDSRYSMYEFKSVGQVEKDFRNQHWKFHD
jgi:hypothetical protein